MRFFVLTASGIVLSLTMVALSHWSLQRSKPDPKTEWKRLAVEPETKERPQRFEGMKWRAEGVELRAPASKSR